METYYELLRLIGSGLIVAYAVIYKNMLSYIESTYPEEWERASKPRKIKAGNWAGKAAINASLKSGILSKLDDVTLTKSKKRLRLLLITGSSLFVAGATLDWFF